MAGLSCESFLKMFQWKVKWLGSIVSLFPECSSRRWNDRVQLWVFSQNVPMECEMEGLNCESFPRMFQWKVKWLGSIESLFPEFSNGRWNGWVNWESFSRMFQWKVKWRGWIVSLFPECSNGRWNGGVELWVFFQNVPMEGEMDGLIESIFPRMFQWKAKWLGSVASLFKKAWLGW